MNKQEKLRELDGMRQAYRATIDTAQKQLSELNIKWQKVIMADDAPAMTDTETREAEDNIEAE